ncbi:hypothetical protein [Streptomyces sp. NPDC091294]|uniref:hypothetical protein n=1 Tax=Streptomyces sp. NPDC091294 TaxID=3365992 RepID=UPI003817FCE1
MPAWITRRRLGVVTFLYAVFLAGWWLGQPVRSDGCQEERHTAGAEGSHVPMEPADLGRYVESLGLDFGLRDWADDLDGRRDGEYGPGDQEYELRYGSGPYVASGTDHTFCTYTKRARLVGWVNGDWS